MKTRVLIFPAEGSNAIELHDSLSTCVNIEVYGMSSVDRQGRYIFKNYIRGTKSIFENGFLDEFNEVLANNQIDFIFPTHDTVALYLRERDCDISAKIITGDLNTVRICRSKIATYELFEGCDFLPHREKSYKNDARFPLFVKPDRGEGAKGTYLVNDLKVLAEVDFSTHIVTEYLPGQELTVDCFTDLNGKLLYVAPRTRERVMAGMSVAGMTLPPSAEVTNIAEVINSRLKFLGLWYFQLKGDGNGKLKLLEVSSRCAGTMCLTRARGVNLPLLSVYTALGYNVTVFDNKYNVSMDRSLTGRYLIDFHYDTVYVDFDDTVTISGKVNPRVMQFLYQCRNKNKRIVLITRHEYDIYDTLQKFSISSKLFDRIMSVDEHSAKAEFINQDSAIFIDNSYHERKDVASKLGIPVFDVDAIDFLLDSRI